jgi:flagellar basal-body rod protein FlgB
MTPVYLFDLAAKQNQWLSVRQAVIAGNVANVNTPGYKAKEVTPFESMLNATHLDMSATQAGHILPAGSGGPAPEAEEDKSWEVLHSGNSVSLEQQMLKAGEVNRAYALNNNIMRAFHGMLMNSVKGA